MQPPKDKHYELMQERVEKSLSAWTGRYTVQDDYTISELTRTYEREDSRGRIKLLCRVYRQTPCLPYELALKAVTDGDPAVREWMARKGQMLDYPDRDLATQLRQDSDPFIRAACFENDRLFDYLWVSVRWIDEFKACSLLERLAMMRNESFDVELVKLILDPDDLTLGIEMSERYQLAKACLVNRRVVENGQRTRRDYIPRRDRWAGGIQFDYSKNVWNLAAKWPTGYRDIPFLAFLAVQTYDSVKAEIYPKCEDFLRSAILQGCLPEDEETLRLGRLDSEQYLRSRAYETSRQMDRQEIEDALLREKTEKDNGAMGGIVMNPWLEPIAREILDEMT